MFKVGYEYKYYLSDTIYVCTAVDADGDAIFTHAKSTNKYIMRSSDYNRYIEIPPIVTKYCIIINSSTIKEYVLSVVFTTEQEAMDYAKRYKEWSSKNVTVGKINYTPNDPFAEKC